MRFVPLQVAGAFRIELDPIIDDRGSFARAWCADELARHGLEPAIAQMNLSTNVRAGTVRGLHHQVPPHAEAKLFRCLRGRSYHAMVDLRPDSPTYRVACGVELDDRSSAAVYLPAGTAAGYQALADDTAVLYTTSTPYAPGTELGLRWDDPALGIDWPIGDGAIVSAKDQAWALLDGPAALAEALPK